MHRPVGVARKGPRVDGGGDARQQDEDELHDVGALDPVDPQPRKDDLVRCRVGVGVRVKARVRIRVMVRVRLGVC